MTKKQRLVISGEHENLPYIFKEEIRGFRLKNIKKEHLVPKNKVFLVRQKGLEPPTFWFVARHSIQLSYWRTYTLFSSAHIAYHTFLKKSRP